MPRAARISSTSRRLRLKHQNIAFATDDIFATVEGRRAGNILYDGQGEAAYHHAYAGAHRSKTSFSCCAHDITLEASIANSQLRHPVWNLSYSSIVYFPTIAALNDWMLRISRSAIRPPLMTGGRPMNWVKPAYCDLRLGFEVTAYVYVR